MRVQKHPVSAPHGSAIYELNSFHFGPAAEKRVYIQASLHADEVPGMLVAQFLRRRLTALEAAGKLRAEIVLVPAANPIGLSQAVHGAPFGRFDLRTGANFNRAFKHVAAELKQTLEGELGDDAAANVRIIRRHARAALAGWKPADDAETLKKTLLELAIGADIVLDLHCDNEAVLHIYSGTPLAAAIAPLSALMQSHATLLTTASGGEPFDEACSRLWWELAQHFAERHPIPAACVAATIELRGERDVSEQLAEADANAILRYLTLNGMLELESADENPFPSPLCAATALEAVQPLLAPQAGVLLYRKALGERVEAGSVIAELIDPVSGESSQVRAGTAGVFFARSAFRHVLRGMNIGKIAGRTAFREGQLLSL
ncbi:MULTISPECIES: succinylglutamate desuccinylase/aspartoacylase family protein [unclassified Duganella]|uniref:succinylglutamate desuccinylase/aspartoacylase family protein n=1 Tax=unclassified Duganella TaxID=2636909 RepID=UPI000B831E18|nr:MULTISPECIES: succinylglutamate desuccinylase/aspartoacylase family protein [unclassified Duganella]